MNYYLIINGVTVGPMTAAQILAYGVNQNTPVSTDGTTWKPLFTYPELMQTINIPPQPYYTPVRESKRLICGLFSLLIGCLGIQYFIIDKVAAGILTILLCLITCGTWTIITFVQGIIMLTMTDQEFEQKYVQSTSTFPLF